MRCLRKAAKVIKRYKVRNDNIRQLVETTLMPTVQKETMEWFGHLMRTTFIQPSARVFNQRAQITNHEEDPGKKMDRWNYRHTNYDMNISEATHME